MANAWFQGSSPTVEVELDIDPGTVDVLDQGGRHDY